MTSGLKALVTGGRGFIGSFLVEDLLNRGFEVRCLLRKSPKGASWLADKDVQIIDGDITDASSLKNATRGLDYVFHVAGLTRARSREEFQQVNVEGSRNLIEAASKYSPGLRRFVFVSSLAAAGPSKNGQPLRENSAPEPISEYGESKLRAEEVLVNYSKDVPVSIVRPPAVFGPRDSDILQIFRYCQRGWLPLVSGGPRYISIIFVKDLVNGLFLAATHDSAAGQTYFLSNDKPCAWEHFGDIVAQKIGKMVKTITVPLPLFYLISCAGEIYGRLSQRAAIINLDKYREIKATHWICSSRKARKEIGFEPKFELADAVEETVMWYKTNGWL